MAGPLTLILRAKKNTPKYLVSDSGNIGVRIPNYSIPLKIIEMLRCPLVLTSANMSDKPSLINAKVIAKNLEMC